VYITKGTTTSSAGAFGPSAFLQPNFFLGGSRGEPRLFGCQTLFYQTLVQIALLQIDHAVCLSDANRLSSYQGSNAELNFMNVHYLAQVLGQKKSKIS